MVLGFEPVDKPIIPRRSFFDKAQFLGYTGMFSVMILPNGPKLKYGVINVPVFEDSVPFHVASLFKI